MDVKIINIKEKANLIKKLNSLKIFAQMNDYYFKLVKLKRKNNFHKHPDTDEVFWGIEGHFQIELRDQIHFAQYTLF
ncbi:MAG: hypothetical protein JXA99_08525 [Candidatus Lokiarchaeota archaeon]|nr:hypothetical protein [Candidatus Lokiarchaeota archaeon]